MTTDLIIAFATLFALELVLGVDNVIFISIIASRLPSDQQKKARTTGLALAVITRVALLMSLSWIISLKEPFFSIFGHGFSGRDLILLAGGLFLIGKSTLEIHHKFEDQGENNVSVPKKISYSSVIFQILILDLVFSLDSVITAVGMVDNLPVMVAAVIASTLVMVFASATISDFVEKHITLKMLALSFLIMIGFTLIIEGWGGHVSKGYIYTAMAFSLFVEFLNIKLKTKTKTKA